jgi:hypothetical protein
MTEYLSSIKSDELNKRGIKCTSHYHRMDNKDEGINIVSVYNKFYYIMILIIIIKNIEL